MPSSAPSLPPRVLLICANYKSEQETRQYVSSVLEQNGFAESRVIVVDNDGSGEPPDVLAELVRLDSRVVVLSPGKNLGYFGAAHWAFTHYLTEEAFPEWVVVSNTDISFEDQDFFARLFEYHSESAPGVIAPSVRSAATGLDQNPHLFSRPSRLRAYSYTLLFRYYPLFLLYCALSMGRKLLRKRLSGEMTKGDERMRCVSRPIYAPQGSFILFHRSYFEAGGTLKHGAFLFGEEVTVAEQARHLGLAVVHDPRLKVVHDEHSTTGTFKSRLVARYQWEAAVHCYREYFR